MKSAHRFIGLFLLVITLMGYLPQAAVAGKAGGRASQPSYYTYEDLKQVAENYRSYFSYVNFRFPSNRSLASLPQPANIIPQWMAQRAGRLVRPQDVQTLSFPWSHYPELQRGDIISIRGGDKSSAVLSWFTSWTHDALVWDGFAHQVLESMPAKDRNHPDGVAVRDTDQSWVNLIAYTMNRVNGVNGYNAATDARRFYEGTPYYPQVDRGTADLLGFFKKWARKDDLNSMYCSKLVWKAYMDKGIDLDSNRTSCFLIFHNIPSPNNWGFNSDAWVGVTPDDIYGSEHLTADIGSTNLASLNWVLSPAMFR